MGSLNPDAESKQELNDSGYVQDETASKQAAEQSKGPQLLDLSDDVLLYILRYCSPQDLKALGFSCARLGALVLDRTLWTDVDAGDTQHGRRRVRWLLAQALGPHTRRLRLSGYAKEAEGCLGFVNRYDTSDSNNAGAQRTSPPEEERYLCGGPRVYRLTQTLPRYGGGFPFWPHAGAGPTLPPQPSPATCPDAPPAADGCPGPQLTLTHTGLRELTAICTSLRTLELEDCVIDCNTINIGMFPRTLTRLSLKGTKCFNLEAKSFLFKIQDHLSNLEELDVSFCSWIEPACMLPLSKMTRLRKLNMRDCPKLAEFVAYASLATRYGFKKLKYLDLRGSPVGDSEVSALGWLPLLEELYLSPSPELPRVKEHAHYSQDMLPSHTELEEWEEKEPDYFKPPHITTEQWEQDEENVLENRSRYYNTTSDDPSACILLERMIAEPVAPEEYSQVYHQFLAGHQNNMPLANPEEYREAYRQYMERPNHAHPPAGYSLFIRKPDDDRKKNRDEPTSAKRRKHDEPGSSKGTDPKPSTSSVDPGPSGSGTSRQAECKPSTSSDEPGPSTSYNGRPASCDAHPARKRDSDDSSDDDSPPYKRACAEPARAEPKPADKAKKDSRGAKKSSKKDANKKKKGPKHPRRVFEITINELNTLELLVPPDMPNSAADYLHHVAHQQDQEANNLAHQANNLANQANYLANEANNLANQANNVAQQAYNVANQANNVAGSIDSDEDNVETGANDDKKEGKVTDEAKNVDNKPSNANNGAEIVINGNNNDNGAVNDNKEGKVINEANNVDNERNYANNANNGANNANNGANNDANNAEPRAMNPIGQAILDAVNNIFNNEEVRNAACNIVENADQEGPGTQRIFQFRQYRRPIVIEEFVNACDEPVGARRLPRGVLFSGNMPGGPVRLDHSALISDSSIRRFGRAIGENINYIHIGGGGMDTNARPDRSNLRVLSVTGYRRVTDATLTHLATAAPHLRELDVSATAVSAAAIANFRAMRPDVLVRSDRDPDPQFPQAD